MSALFSSLQIRGIEFKNRIAVSPMCQYSSVDGMPSEWHLVHLGSRAAGGAALVMAEATAVSPEGRISPDDAGIWDEKHVEAYKRITSFIKSQNALAGIQLAHAGRKASTYSPSKGNGTVKESDGGWQTLAPSYIPFSEEFPHPREMNLEEIKVLKDRFRDAAERSIRAGFEVIELHMAHGYLIHEFLSPLSNLRGDLYGGSLENRCRLAIEIAGAVRKVLHERIPLFARISSTDWTPGGWDLEESIQLAKWLKEEGVDLIDCSSGGNVHQAKIPAGPGYQIKFSEKIKNGASIFTGGVGFITSPAQAEQIIATGQADLVFLAREFLRNPYWPHTAANELKVDIDWPVQYTRAK